MRHLFQIVDSFPRFISQGSVAMQLRCDGINDYFITRLLLSPTVKELWKSVNIWRSYGLQ